MTARRPASSSTRRSLFSFRHRSHHSKRRSLAADESQLNTAHLHNEAQSYYYERRAAVRRVDVAAVPCWYYPDTRDSTVLYIPSSYFPPDPEVEFWAVICFFGSFTDLRIRGYLPIHEILANSGSVYDDERPVRVAQIPMHTQIGPRRPDVAWCDMMAIGADELIETLPSQPKGHEVLRTKMEHERREHRRAVERQKSKLDVGFLDEEMVRRLRREKKISERSKRVRDSWKVGSKLDIKSDGVWYGATIKDVQEGSDLILVGYDGFDASFDDWTSRYAHNMAPYRRFSKPVETNTAGPTSTSQLYRRGTVAGSLNAMAMAGQTRSPTSSTTSGEGGRQVGAEERVKVMLSALRRNARRRPNRRADRLEEVLRQAADIVGTLEDEEDSGVDLYDEENTNNSVATHNERIDDLLRTARGESTSKSAKLAVRLKRENAQLQAELEDLRADMVERDTRIAALEVSLSELTEENTSLHDRLTTAMDNAKVVFNEFLMQFGDEDGDEVGASQRWRAARLDEWQSELETWQSALEQWQAYVTVSTEAAEEHSKDVRHWQRAHLKSVDTGYSAVATSAELASTEAWLDRAADDRKKALTEEHKRQTDEIIARSHRFLPSPDQKEKKNKEEKEKKHRRRRRSRKTKKKPKKHSRSSSDTSKKRRKQTKKKRKPKKDDDEASNPKHAHQPGEIAAGMKNLTSRAHELERMLREAKTLNQAVIDAPTPRAHDDDDDDSDDATSTGPSPSARSARLGRVLGLSTLTNDPETGSQASRASLASRASSKSTKSRRHRSPTSSPSKQDRDAQHARTQDLLARVRATRRRLTERDT